MAGFTHVLVPLDGSALAEQALPLALTLVKAFNSKLTLLRATDFLHPTLLAPHLSSVTAEAIANAYEHCALEAKLYLHQVRNELHQRGVKVEILLEDAQPAEAIIDAATRHEVDCIVMSTHGRSGLARWTMGSVADKVVHRAPCPVLLVRQHNETGEEALPQMLDRLLSGKE